MTFIWPLILQGQSKQIELLTCLPEPKLFKISHKYGLIIVFKYMKKHLWTLLNFSRYGHFSMTMSRRGGAASGVLLPLQGVSKRLEIQE